MPEDAGGTDDVDNLVDACHACNLYKSAAWNPESPPVLHPLRTDMTTHTALLPDGVLQALTPEGNRHIETLHLNRSPLIAQRNTRRLIANLIADEAERIEREKTLDAQTREKKRRVRQRRKRLPP